MIIPLEKRKISLCVTVEDTFWSKSSTTKYNVFETFIAFNVDPSICASASSSESNLKSSKALNENSTRFFFSALLVENKCKRF